MNMRRFLKTWAPPGVITSVQRAMDHLRPAPWEYLAEGWSSTERKTRGWEVPSVAETQIKLWPAFLESVEGTNPLGVGRKQNTDYKDLELHNLYSAYAYVAAMAGSVRTPLTVLDWGSGVGHYNVLTNSVLPGKDIEYYCHDLPAICKAGRELLPEGKFLENESDCFSRKYDLIIASASLWYEEDWRSVVEKLVDVSDGFLYLTRMLFVPTADSYVAIQRPWAMGYKTEYPCWIFNRREFVDFVCSRGTKLVREFLIGAGPPIHRAPEQSEYRGFLFQKC